MSITALRALGRARYNRPSEHAPNPLHRSPIQPRLGAGIELIWAPAPRHVRSHTARVERGERRRMAFSRRKRTMSVGLAAE